MSDDLDEWAAELGIDLRDNSDICRHPNDQGEQVPCNYGNCVSMHCFQCGRWWGGVGPVGCACDNSRGWRKGDPRQMSRPHPPVKAIGRHRGEILRRRAEVTEYRSWLASLNLDVR